MKSLTFWATSSNPAVIEDSAISVSNNGTNQTLMVKTGIQMGTATINVFAADPAGGTDSTGFNITVTSPRLKAPRLRIIQKDRESFTISAFVAPDADLEIEASDDLSSWVLESRGRANAEGILESVATIFKPRKFYRARYQ